MMKKMFLTLAMIIGITTAAMAQAEIKFDKLTYDFGDFSENDPVQTAKFTFTNVGDKPLIINQAISRLRRAISTWTVILCWTIRAMLAATTQANGT